MVSPVARVRTPPYARRANLLARMTMICPFAKSDNSRKRGVRVHVPELHAAGMPIVPDLQGYWPRLRPITRRTMHS